VLSRNIKTFAVSSLVLNLFASQIGELFLPHPVQTSGLVLNREMYNVCFESRTTRMHCVCVCVYVEIWNGKQVVCRVTLGFAVLRTRI